jgi:hypothetical protein
LSVPKPQLKGKSYEVSQKEKFAEGRACYLQSRSSLVFPNPAASGPVFFAGPGHHKNHPEFPFNTGFCFADNHFGNSLPYPGEFYNYGNLFSLADNGIF